MKKLVIFLCIGLLTSVVFAKEFNTGDVFGYYYPKGAPEVANKNGSSSSCYISEISIAENYPEGTYNLKLISADWVGASVFPLYFNYIIRKGEILEFSRRNIYLGSDELVKIKVVNVSDNTIEIEEVAESTF